MDTTWEEITKKVRDRLELHGHTPKLIELEMQNTLDGIVRFLDANPGPWLVGLHREVSINPAPREMLQAFRAGHSGSYAVTCLLAPRIDMDDASEIGFDRLHELAVSCRFEPSDDFDGPFVCFAISDADREIKVCKWYPLGQIGRCWQQGYFGQ